jgi:hypothetical protein
MQLSDKPCCQSEEKTTNQHDIECMSSLRGEITLWVPRRWWPMHRHESPCVVARARVYSLVTHVPSQEPLYGVMSLCIYKMTKWCSKFEFWTAICRYLLEIMQRRLLFPSICDCLSASWQQCRGKLWIEQESSAWNWFLTVRERQYVLGSAQSADLTALFWSAIASNCQGYCFEMQGAARARSKSWTLRS